MKLKLLLCAICAGALTMVSCEKSTVDQTVELTKKHEADFIGYFPGGPLGFGPGMVEMYGGTTQSTFQGSDQPRSFICAGVRNDCVIIARVSGGINKSPMNNAQRTELQNLASDGTNDEVQDYFLTGTGATMLEPLAEVAPEFWEGLQDGTMTIHFGGYDETSELSTIIITDLDTTLDDLDLTANNFYAFEI